MTAVIVALGGLGHAWAFALAPSWIKERRGIMRGALAHAAVLGASLFVLGLAQLAGSWVFGPDHPALVTSCFQIEPAAVCRSHVADVLPRSFAHAGGRAPTRRGGR